MAVGVAGVMKSSATDVVVLGNTTLDMTLRGIAAVPSWGTEVVATGHARVLGGQAYILAR